MYSTTGDHGRSIRSIHNHLLDRSVFIYVNDEQQCNININLSYYNKIISSIIPNNMKALTLILAVFLVVSTSSRCTDRIQCFKSRLFNFDSPGEGIYQLPSITNSEQNPQINILAYGDFDNNLYTDFIAQFNSNASLAIFAWNTQSLNFEMHSSSSSLVTSECTPQSVFLYDLDINGLLDVVVWGTANNQNCLLPFIHQSDSTFSKGALFPMQNTSNPFVIAYGTNNDQDRSVALLAFMNGQRTILKYNNGAKNFTSIPFTQVFQNSGNFATVPFADPHWNSFLDLTGNCRSDVVIVDQNKNIQFWINDGNIFQYQNSITNVGNFTALTFNDINYNGIPDMVLSYSSGIKIFLNTREPNGQADFCKAQYKSVSFNTTESANIAFDNGSTMKQGTLQIKDVNMDGFADFLVPLTTGSTNYTVKIYLSEEGKSFATNDQYNLPMPLFQNIISVSFIDLLENGIMDFIVCTKNGIFSFYNNYLQQNLFFIKGFGATGQNSTSGAQIVGASFYWVNSVGQGYRTTFQPQIPQTAYNALQTPFAYCGLGRANNYVESFTLGMFGNYQSWSPIIPNSQLAVYAPGPEPKEWGIRIYVLPTESLIYVVIVSAIILTVFGIILAVLKCKNHKKRDEPLMQFIH